MVDMKISVTKKIMYDFKEQNKKIYKLDIMANGISSVLTTSKEVYEMAEEYHCYLAKVVFKEKFLYSKFEEKYTQKTYVCLDKIISLIPDVA